MAPLVAYGLEGNGLAILLYGDWLCQFGLVIHDERDQHILMHMLGYFRFAQHGSLHLATVDTTKAVEVQEHRHVVRLGICHTFFVIGKGDLSAMIGHGLVLSAFNL